MDSSPASTIDIQAGLDVEPTAVSVADGTLTVELEDGRTISVPTAWYPRLHHGTPDEHRNYELTPVGIHWPDLDEDISIRGLLLGRKSGENPKSIKWWLDQRAKGRKTTYGDYFNEVIKGRKPTAAAAKKSRSARGK